MTAVGGSLEEMTLLGKVFHDNAAQAQAIKSTVDTNLLTTRWTGPAAERFREQWAQFSPALDQLQQALSDAGIEVDRRREALDVATR